MLRFACGCLLGCAFAVGLPTATAQPPQPAASPADVLPGVVDLTPPELPGRRVTITEVAPATSNPRAILTSVEYLIVRPRRRDLDFALVDPADDLTPVGRIRSVPWDTTSGVRVGLGYRPADSLWESMFTYTYLHSGADRTVEAPPGGVLYPTLTRPGLVDRATLAAAGSSVTFNVFDLEAGRRFCVDENFILRLSAGTRWASIDQSLQAFYFGGDAAGARARQRIDFDGAGLTLGGQGEWALGRGFRVFGKARGSLLVGEFATRLRESNQNGLVVNADVSECYVQTVPVLEMATGVAWEYRNLRLSVGYELANWFNMADAPTFVDDFAEGKYGRKRSDISLEGVFFQLGLAF